MSFQKADKPFEASLKTRAYQLSIPKATNESYATAEATADKAREEIFKETTALHAAAKLISSPNCRL